MIILKKYKKNTTILSIFGLFILIVLCFMTFGCMGKKVIKTNGKLLKKNVDKIQRRLKLKALKNKYNKNKSDKNIVSQEYMFKKNVIGCLLPLSGQFSIFGKKALKGIEMAVQNLSKQYKQNIIILIKDTQSNDKKAVQCVKELAEKKVGAIIGPMVTAELAGKQAEELKIPMIAMTQKNNIVENGKYIFNNFLTPQMQTNSLVSHAFVNLGITKFAILYPEDRYGKTYMNLFLAKVNKLGGKVVGAASYTHDQTDFSDAVKKILSSSYALSDSIKKTKIHDPKNNPNHENKDKQEKLILDFEAIFIPDAPLKLSLILPHLVYNDIIDVYLLGTNIWHHNDLIKNSSEYINNSVITQGYFAKSKNVNALKFAEKFKILYNKNPGFIEACAYDTLKILVQTAMDPDIYSQESLIDTLAGKRIFDGITGKTRFDKNGNAHKELFFLTVKNGKFVEIKR